MVFRATHMESVHRLVPHLVEVVQRTFPAVLDPVQIVNVVQMVSVNKMEIVVARRFAIPIKIHVFHLHLVVNTRVGLYQIAVQILQLA